MTYLRNPNARAINPEFVSAYRAYEAVKQSADKPIKEKDVHDFKAALAVFGITTGKKLGEVLYEAGLVGQRGRDGKGEAKDKGTKTGQNRFKDPTTLSFKEFEAIARYCDKYTEEAYWEATSLADDIEEHGYFDEAQEYRDGLQPILDANSFFYRVPRQELDRQAAAELESRAILDGMELLDRKHRQALLLNLQGMLMAQYRNPGKNRTDVARGRRARMVAAAIDEAVTDGVSNKYNALADLVGDGNFHEEDIYGNGSHSGFWTHGEDIEIEYEDGRTEVIFDHIPIGEDTPQEAIFNEYTATKCEG